MAAANVDPGGTGTTETEFYFHSSGSSDPDGNIVSYEWQIDGVPVATGWDFTHTFTASGTYVVTLVVTDDGVATGATMQAALWAARQEKPAMLIAALPVGPQDTMPKLSEHADETVCLRAPPVFSAIGQFYSQFAQVQDDELLKILKQENLRRAGA
jgi:hypothetical protein